MKKQGTKKQAVLAALLVMGFILGVLPRSLQAQAEVRNSRLSQLIKHKPSLYLPNRLLIGEDNHFTVQGPAGSHVVLYISPQPQGVEAPDGQALRVGDDNHQLTGSIPENGVLEMTFPVPAEEELVGKKVYVEAITWKADDYSDLQVFDLVDAAGRKATENHLAFEKPSKGKGALIIPTMPGLSPQILQQMTTFSDIQKGDKRKRELIDGGNVNKDVIYDRNVFIQRPGSFPTQPR